MDLYRWLGPDAVAEQTTFRAAAVGTAFDGLTAELKSAGFSPVQDYQVPESPQTNFNRALIHREDRIYATVSHVGDSGPQLSLTTKLVDGSFVITLDRADAAPALRPPDHRRFVEAGKPVADVVNAHKMHVRQVMEAAAVPVADHAVGRYFTDLLEMYRQETAFRKSGHHKKGKADLDKTVVWNPGAAMQRTVEQTLPPTPPSPPPAPAAPVDLGATMEVAPTAFTLPEVDDTVLDTSPPSVIPEGMEPSAVEYQEPASVEEPAEPPADVGADLQVGPPSTGTPAKAKHGMPVWVGLLIASAALVAGGFFARAPASGWLMKSADALMASGQAAGAATRYRLAARVKRLPLLHENLGLALAASGSTAEGRAILEKTAIEGDVSGAGLFALGSMARADGKLDQAAQWLAQAAEKSPDQAEVVAALGEVEFERGHAAEAAAAFGRVASFKPDYPKIYARLGEAALLSRQADLAMDAFQRAVAVDPDYLEGHRALAELYLQGSRWVEAAAAAQVVVQKDPAQIAARFLLARAQAGMKSWKDAAASLKQILQADPRSIEAWSWLAQVQYQGGSAKDAIAAAKQALAVNADLSDMHFVQALAYGRLRQSGAAIAALREALVREPGLLAKAQSDPVLASVRRTPQYKRLVKDVKGR